MGSMKNQKIHADQLDFVCLAKDKPRVRPNGPTDMVDGMEVFRMPVQQVKHVAWTLGATKEHVYGFIDKGEFPNVIDISSDGARLASYRIPREDLLAFIARRQEQAFRGK